MSQMHDVPKMVEVYKKLFILIVSVTALGIVLSALHMPLFWTVIIALSIIVFKGKIVYDSFKDLLIGKNALIVVFILTIFFFLMILLLPLFNHENLIVGTEDISKDIQAQEHAQGGGHGH